MLNAFSVFGNERIKPAQMSVHGEAPVRNRFSHSRLVAFFIDVSSDHGEDDLPTEGVFEGHQEAVNAMQIHNGLLYTCSGDRTVRAFDLVVSVGEGDGRTSRLKLCQS